jgi:hypothetical protein
VLGNADLSVPVNRAALDPAVVNALRPYPAYGAITPFDYRSTSQYNSLQVTLSRQTSRRLQYFVAYTLSRAEGTLASEYDPRDPFDPKRSYGILETDRTHVLSVSWNAMLPDGARGRLDTSVGRGVLNGWQISGISNVLSGTPIHLPFSGAAYDSGVPQAYFGTPDVVYGYGQGQNLQNNALVPVYTCDPTLNGSKVGDKLLNIACVSVPPFGTNGSVIPQYNVRGPWHSVHDLTLFKNFPMHGSQKLQFRAGFFDIFNTAYANTTIGSPDVDFALDTVCNHLVDHVPNGAGGYKDRVCDPSGGYHYTQNTIDNFGKILLKRGHRVIELVMKYYF